MLLKVANDRSSKIVIENVGGEHSSDIFNRMSNGDYVISAVEHEPYLNNETAGVMVSILFKAQYGYYILNNYLPSFLMFVIAYSTFFFPLSNFNERVMVSLTSQLVLAAFFSQASESTVHTPYVKMIDAWFAGLITFNFLIVIVNVIVNGIPNTKVRAMSTSKLNRPESNAMTTADETVNNWGKVLVGAAFIGFLSAYIILAI